MIAAPGPRGFTVIELVVVLAIVLSIAGALAHAVQPARAAFDRVPAVLDLDQRGRLAIDALSQALRSAGHYVVSPGPALTVMIPVVHGAQGILAVDHASPGAHVTLAATPCPNLEDVCGFNPGMTALVTNASREHDVFVVASTIPGARALASDRNLAHAYPAGSAVIEIDQYTFSLLTQADGSLSLIRETAAGAIQPMVDFVSAVSFSAVDQQVDVAVTVQASTSSLRRVLADRVFTTSIKLRNGS